EAGSGHRPDETLEPPRSSRPKVVDRLEHGDEGTRRGDPCHLATEPGERPVDGTRGMALGFVDGHERPAVLLAVEQGGLRFSVEGGPVRGRARDARDTGRERPRLGDAAHVPATASTLDLALERGREDAPQDEVGATGV